MKILYIAPASYPIKSSECISNVKAAYVLAEGGHEVDVVSVNTFDKYYPSAADEEFLSQNIRIYYVKDTLWVLKSGFFWQCFRRLYCWILSLFYGYYYVGNYTSFAIWKYFKKYLSKNNYDVVITRTLRMEVVGILISKNYNIPWIANWNDPTIFPPPYGPGSDKKLFWGDKKIQDDMQKYATFHTFPSSRLRDYMLVYLVNIRKENTVVIPHIALTKLYLSSVVGGDKLKLLHAGNVGYPRNPEPFLCALSKVLKIGNNKKKITCDFVGLVTRNFEVLVKELDLSDNVRNIPSVPYTEMPKLQQNYHLSLIIEADCEEGIYLPTKVVDTVQAGLPIFCVSPQNGTLHDIINEYKNGYFSDVKSIDNITAELLNAIDDFENNNLPRVITDRLPYFFEENALNLYNQVFEKIVSKVGDNNYRTIDK